MIESNILLYETDEGKTNVDVILKDETIWLTQKSMSELFDVNVSAINKHLNNIYEEKELDKNSTISKMEIVEKKEIGMLIENQNFIIWMLLLQLDIELILRKQLKDYMIKVFVIDVDKMKNGPKFGKDYYDELLQTIKEIRLSERRQYQKITDVFETTSVDYNKDSEEAYTFFKIVQNKLYLL